MSARLQHLDATQGFGLKELVASRGLLHEFHEHTWALLNPWISNGSDHSQKLKVIVDHMGRMRGKKFDKQGCYQSIRSYTLSVSSAVWAEIELKFWHWPFVLLRGVRGSAANEEADSVLDSFFDEDLCCLDSWWGLWLRATLASREELKADELQSLLKEIERKGLCTNMGLEGLLGSMKAAPPGSNNAEKFAYVGHLTQLMHRHLAKGRPDFRRTSFNDMRKAGVPLDIPRSEGRRVRASRPDARYVMKRLHRFLQANPQCTLADCEAEQRRLYQERSCIGGIEQHKFVATLQEDAGVGAEMMEQVDPPALEGVFLGPSWDAGDESLPVSEPALNLLKESCPAAGSDGIANKMQRLRWDSRARLVMKDSSLIQESDVFPQRLSCWQKHPGLCLKKDAAIYEVVLQLAALLEAFFVESYLHQFFRILPALHIGNAAGSHFRTSFDNDLVVCFTRKRRRRSHAQVTHVGELPKLDPGGVHVSCTDPSVLRLLERVVPRKVDDRNSRSCRPTVPSPATQRRQPPSGQWFLQVSPYS